MAKSFVNSPLSSHILPWFRGFDGPLAFAVFLLVRAGLLTMYSAGFDNGSRFEDHGRPASTVQAPKSFRIPMKSRT